MKGEKDREKRVKIRNSDRVNEKNAPTTSNQCAVYAELSSLANVAMM